MKHSVKQIKRRSAVVKTKKENQVDLLAEYSKKIKPLVKQAKQARGSRLQATPMHSASRQYTDLLVEYYRKGGSIAMIAGNLGVTYAGIRRRIMMSKIYMPAVVRGKEITEEMISAAVARVKDARAKGTHKYHAQLAKEREDGIPLASIAKGLGISSSGPLYYGVQRYYMTKSSK